MDGELTMPLDPLVQAMCERRERDQVPPLYGLTVEQARAADLAAIRASSGTPEPVHRVADLTFPGPDGPLPLRVFRPCDEPRPALIYFYGGGWTLGSIDTADAVCRSLANASGLTVLAPGYRLAPENPFPAAVHDCYAALCWIAEHARSLGVDPSRLAVGGDSAGGNLAAALTLLARDRHGPTLTASLLVYPNTDYLSQTGSLDENTNPYLFNRTSVDWYWRNYLTDPRDGTDPLASPLLAESLAGLPSTMVITAEYDPLRDQAEQYADRLARSGVPVLARRFDGMVHGFFCMAGELPAGREAIEAAAAYLCESLTR